MKPKTFLPKVVATESQLKANQKSCMGLAP